MLNEGRSYLFYTNLGLSVTSMRDLQKVIKKVFKEKTTIIVSSSWVLTTLCSLELEELGIITDADLGKITRWENKIFMNFTYEELREYIPHIRYILINYIDPSNIKICSLPGFQHEWKVFSVLRFMAYSETVQQTKNTQPSQLDKHIFRYFLPLNIFMDRNNTLRYRSYKNRPLVEITNSPTQTFTDKNNIILKYPFEKMPMLQILDTKLSMQYIFKSLDKNKLFITNLDTTYSISKNLFKVLQEELYVQIYFMNGTMYISSGKNSNDAPLSMRKSTNNVFNNEFFYFKDTTYTLFNNNTDLNITYDFFTFYSTFVNVLRKHKKYILMTAPFDYSITKRITHTNYIQFANFTTNFSRLQSNMPLIL